jgi:short-subunit dehydrogenase
MWLTAEYVARSSLKALEHGGLYCTPSLLYKLIVLAGRLGMTRFVRGSILKRVGRDGK